MLAIYIFLILGIIIGFLLEKSFTNVPDSFFDTVFYSIFWGMQILIIVAATAQLLREKLYAISIGITLGFISYSLVLIYWIRAISNN